MNRLDKRLLLAYRASPKRRLKRTVIQIVCAIVAGVSAAYYLTQPSGERAVLLSTYFRLDQTGRDQAAQLSEEPCNRPLAAKFAEMLVEKKRNSAAISFIYKTEEKCGPNEDLVMPLFRAQYNSKDFIAAEATMDKVLHENPRSLQAHILRGKTRARRKNYQGAYSDLNQSVYRYSDPSVAFPPAVDELALVTDKLKGPCEAITVLQDFIAYDPSGRRTPERLAQIGKWQKKGSCPDPFGTGTTNLSFNKNGNIIILPVTINGIVGRMAIDTGASHTVLTSDFAERAGIVMNTRKGSYVVTGNGVAWMRIGRAQTITLGNSSASNVPILVQSADKLNLRKGVVGLLGLSFLGNFKMTIDDGVLELAPLEPR